MSDPLAEAYRNLALAFEPDLKALGPPLTMTRFWIVSNDRGLTCSSLTELGAWTAAYEAAKRRAAWRLAKVERKAEDAANRRPAFRPIGSMVDRPSLLIIDDDGPGAA